MKLEHVHTYTAPFKSFVPSRGVYVAEDDTIYASATINGELIVYRFNPSGTVTCISVDKGVVIGSLCGNVDGLVLIYVNGARDVMAIRVGLDLKFIGTAKKIGVAGAYTPGPSVAVEPFSSWDTIFAVWVTQSAAVDAPGSLTRAKLDPNCEVAETQLLTNDCVNADVDADGAVAYRSAAEMVESDIGRWRGYDPSIDGEHVGYHYQGYAYVSGYQIGKQIGEYGKEGGKFVHVADMGGSAFVAWSTYPSSAEATASKAAASNAVRGIGVAIVSDGEIEQRIDPTDEKGQLAVHGVDVALDGTRAAVVWRTESNGQYTLKAALYSL